MARFGVILPQYDLPADRVVAIAKDCERLGFDSYWFEDHFWPWPAEPTATALECWTTLSYVAAKTEKIRLGTLCTCNSYRKPTLLAKMASTLDNLSGGRLELGIGAGWYEEEYRAHGIEFPKPSVRIAQLKESIQIIKAMWTQPSPTFDGRYYRINGAMCNPKPLQKPHPPIWVG